MIAYSLINCLTGYFSIGMYTSLDNLYHALRIVARRCTKSGLSQDSIKISYKVKKVYLDVAPLKFYEFSRYGEDIEIDWEKVF